MPESYVEFRLHPPYPNRKTSVWSVLNKHHGDLLGLIVWRGGWRQYVLEPEAGCVFSKGCLIDIAHFIFVEMDKRRKTRRRVEKL